MKSHTPGTLETVKYAAKRAKYHDNLAKILDLGYEKEDFIHYFPAFAGDMTILRNLTLYEFYKSTLGIAGHIAEIGVYKGASSILFGKLVQMLEPNSLTMVHGFDWFKGTDAVPENPLQVQGGNLEDETRLRELIRLQELDGTVKVHNLNVETDLHKFFQQHPHLQFKLVFLDSGTYECTSAAIRAFWPRLAVGGVMIFDQYNNEVSPGETRAVQELLPNVQVKQMKDAWMPASYVVKGGN